MNLRSYVLKIEPPILPEEPLEKTYGIINLIVIVIMVVIVGVRRLIYYSPPSINEDFTLSQILQKWRIIDIILLAVIDTIALCGIVITFLGTPFNRTFHFFLASALLMIILMPVGLKIKGKLSILRKTHPEV